MAGFIIDRSRYSLDAAATGKFSVQTDKSGFLKDYTKAAHLTSPLAEVVPMSEPLPALCSPSLARYSLTYPPNRISQDFPRI